MTLLYKYYNILWRDRIIIALVVLILRYISFASLWLLKLFVFEFEKLRSSTYLLNLFFDFVVDKLCVLEVDMFIPKVLQIWCQGFQSSRLAKICDINRGEAKKDMFIATATIMATLRLPCTNIITHATTSDVHKISWKFWKYYH